jgi:hypothetical protein
MTTSTNDPIDAVVAALGAAGADLPSPVRHGHAGVIYNSADDTFTQTSAAPTAGMTAQPLLDDGRDLQAARDEIVANVSALEAKFNSGKYDAETGQFKYNITGRDRDVLEMQIQQARNSGAYDIARLNEIFHQRVTSGQEAAAPGETPFQLANGQTTTLLEAAARMSYIDAAPPGQRAAFAAEYDRLMQDGKTQSVVKAINAARRL